MLTRESLTVSKREKNGVVRERQSEGKRRQVKRDRSIRAHAPQPTRPEMRPNRVIPYLLVERETRTKSKNMGERVTGRAT